VISILLDQGLAPRTAILLAHRGIDAAHVSEIGMAEADDAQILDAARLSGRVCVTLDHDFHARLALSGHGRPSVILLRAEGSPRTSVYNSRQSP
jgi:predicted nuclease of predicted toxin-antitoxin system